MKELINKFKRLELTKRLVILFITISFIFIVGITLYNALTDNFGNKKEIVATENIEKNNDENEEKIKDEKIKENDTNNQIENEIEAITGQDKTDNTKDKNITSNSKQQSSKTDSSNGNQNSSSLSNQESSNNTTDITEKETISVHIQVIGMGETMMSDNLTVEKGSNAYSVLKEIAAKNGKTISGSSTYVTGIGGLNAKEHGAGSGWMYKVNGIVPSKPAVAYTLSQGDSVIWYYVNYE